ncbi:hypothetical protein [Mollivirus kamchatka]|nr:hypothetical protein [Mollivirus kamchatka]
MDGGRAPSLREHDNADEVATTDPYVVHQMEEQPGETICIRPLQRRALPRCRLSTGHQSPRGLSKEASRLSAVPHMTEVLHGWFSHTVSVRHGYDLYVREDGCLVKITRTSRSPTTPRSVWADNHYAGVLVRKVQSNLKERGWRQPYHIVGRPPFCWMMEQRKALEPQADGHCRSESVEELETRRAFWEWMDHLDQ